MNDGQTLGGVSGEITAVVNDVWATNTRHYLEALSGLEASVLPHAAIPQTPVAISLDFTRGEHARAPYILARTGVLSCDRTPVRHGRRVIESKPSNTPESWKPVTSVGFVEILSDPGFGLANMTTFKDKTDQKELWRAYCLPQGIIYLRTHDDLHNARDDQDGFQYILNENVKVIAVPTTSAHASLNQTRVLQDLLELLIVKKSVQTTNGFGMPFPHPKITVRMQNT